MSTLQFRACSKMLGRKEVALERTRQPVYPCTIVKYHKPTLPHISCVFVFRGLGLWVGGTRVGIFGFGHAVRAA